MLEKVIIKFMPEITKIKARNYHVLKKNSGFLLHSSSFSLEAESHLWLPVLCLASAKTAREPNALTLQLAGSLHLFSLATQLHWSISDDETNPPNDGNKYSILMGDLLYSLACAEISRPALQPYLPTFADMIYRVHLEKLRRDLSADEYGGLFAHPAIMINLGETACLWGARSVCENACITEMPRKLGACLGQLRAHWERNPLGIPEPEVWYQAWDICARIPSAEGRAVFRTILGTLGEKWEGPNRCRNASL